MTPELTRRLFLGTAAACCRPAAAADSLREDALAALHKAVEFYRTRVGVRGGYVYYTSLDLTERWGEGKAAADVAFVQPPGTPTVGAAYLRAFAATKDRFYLDAAQETAATLAAGRLKSGGWAQTFVIAPGAKPKDGNSSLDDNQTQSALAFLADCDQALDFKHAAIHSAAVDGLDALLKAQFPNGAFPQVFRGPAAKQPLAKATYPEYDWRTEGRVKNYWDYYTLNDGLCGTVAATLVRAAEVYGEKRFTAALAWLGDFLLAAQMPDPQPAWCQQYNYEMLPIWARKFEPPAITGSESQDAMETLITIARRTGGAKYLEPIPRALDYFTERCLLPDGRVARFYELRTNKPLYMNAQYELTYDDSAAPSHYGWKQSQRFERIRRAHAAAAADLKPEPVPPRRVSAAEVRRVVDELDAEGRWVSVYAGEGLTGQPKFANGFRYLSSAVFSRNIEMLSAFLADAGR